MRSERRAPRRASGYVATAKNSGNVRPGSVEKQPVYVPPSEETKAAGVLELLKLIRPLIAQSWGPEFGVDGDGVERVSVVAAIQGVGGGRPVCWWARAELSKYTRAPIANWERDRLRTKREVVALFDRTIKGLRGFGPHRGGWLVTARAAVPQ